MIILICPSFFLAQNNFPPSKAVFWDSLEYVVGSELIIRDQHANILKLYSAKVKLYDKEGNFIRDIPFIQNLVRDTRYNRSRLFNEIKYGEDYQENASFYYILSEVNFQSVDYNKYTSYHYWLIKPILPSLIPNIDPFYYYREQAVFILGANGLDFDSLYRFRIELNGIKICDDINGRSNFSLTFDDSLKKYSINDPSKPDVLTITALYNNSSFLYSNPRTGKIEESKWTTLLKTPRDDDPNVDLDIYSFWSTSDDYSNPRIEKRRLYWGNNHAFRFCWDIRKGDKNILMPPDIAYGDFRVETDPVGFFDIQSTDFDENWAYLYLKRSKEIELDSQSVKLTIQFRDSFGNEITRNFRADLYK